MTVVFADTYYYLAWANPHDAGHAAARQFAMGYRGTLVTTSAVLLELGDALCRGANRLSFLSLVRDILEDSNTTFVYFDSSVLTRAIELYRSRLDKDWSLTDCVSFAVMAEFGLTEALTADHHFEQAGFRALLKSNLGP